MERNNDIEEIVFLGKRCIDIVEEGKVAKFQTESCGWNEIYNGTPCS
jgi:hypothetical protein